MSSILRNKISAGFLTAAATLLVTSGAQAQTVTVDASLVTPNNTTTFNKLSDAILSFATTGVNGPNGAANLINITPTTPVTDKIVVDVDAAAVAPVTIAGDITIQGNGGMATLIGLPLSDAEQKLRNSTTAPPLPGLAWRQPVNLTIKNLAMIPGDPTMFSLAIFKAPSSVGSWAVNLENCIFTANKNNAPITLTGKDDPDVNEAGVIALKAGGDGIWAISQFARGDLTVNMKDTIIASHTILGTGTNLSDCIIPYMQGTTSDFINIFLNINEGCVLANSNRGIQNPYGGYVKINGTAAKPVVIRKMTSHGLWNSSDTTGNTQPTAASVNYARFYQCGLNAITEANTRAFISTITNTIIADCGSDGVNLSGNGALPPNGESTSTVSIHNVVIHNSGSGSNPGGVYAAGVFNRTLDVANSVFTSTAASKYGLVNNSTTGVFNVADSILSLTGTNALLGATAGAGVTNLGTNVTNGEVLYVNMTDPFSPDFFRIPGSSNVNEWSVY